MTTKTKPAPARLAAIAAAMRATIQQTGAAWVHQRLERGLEIVLQRRIEENGAYRWRLALGRPGVQPSDDEIAICRTAFNVPIATEWELDSKMRINHKTKTATTWWIAALYWTEAA